MYEDYFITRIGNTTQTSSKFWGILKDYKFTPVGGCQEKVAHGDDLLFAFDAFSKAHFLKLEGATVGNVLTDTAGHATLSFKNLGAHVLKAERSDSIRSNGITLNVIVKGTFLI